MAVFQESRVAVQYGANLEHPDVAIAVEEHVVRVAAAVAKEFQTGSERRSIAAVGVAVVDGVGFKVRPQGRLAVIASITK